MHALRARRFRSAAVPLLLSVAGCSADAGSDGGSSATARLGGEAVAPTVATVDGVRTLTHDAAAFDRAPRLELEPEPIAVLGAPDDDPAYDLTSVDEVALLADGRAMTLARVGSRALVFGEDGRGRRALGREGQGPGELMAPRALVALPGDTTFVPDVGNSRFNWATADGGIVRDATMPSDTLLVFGLPVARALDDGRVPLVVPSRSVDGGGDAEGATRWKSCALALLTPASGETRVIAATPCWEVATIETRRRGRRRLETIPLRLGRRLHVASVGSALAMGRGDGYAFELRAPDMAVQMRLRVDRPRRAVTAAMRDVVVARELAVVDAPGGERRVDRVEDRRLAREEPFADSLPPYSAILTSRDNTIWVVDAIAPTDTGWAATAFRADGTIVGRLHAAGRGRPMAFEGDRVAVRAEDEDGVVTVRVHRIRPTAR